MKLDVLPVAGKIHTARLTNTTAIVIDVLRGTTNMILGIKNGAIKIIPTFEAADAASFVSRIGARDSLLAGETGGLKTPGFDIGNSPFEFDAAHVRGRTVVMSTTNGTAAVCAAASAENVLIGAMINATAVGLAAAKLGRDVLIVCAGTDGMISAEDLIGAGAIANVIDGAAEVEQTDIVAVCRYLYRDYKENRFDLHDVFHYRRLLELGFEKDLAVCLEEDSTDIVPVYENGILTARVF